MSAERAFSAAQRPPPGVVGARMGELFVTHGRMVYGLCRLLLRDPVEAEDAAQQTFLSAHASMLGGSVPRKPAAWLAAIARNECLVRVRARMREPLPLDVERERGGQWPEETLELQAQVRALNDALRALPERQRQAFVLRELYGLRYREVGIALGLSLPAVQSLLLRARRQLQRALRPLHVAPALVVPTALRDALTESIPGFAAGSAGAGGGAGIVAAVLAKAAAGPVGAKVAAATVAASAVGAAGVGGLPGDQGLPEGPEAARAQPAPTRLKVRTQPRPVRVAPTPVARVATTPRRRRSPVVKDRVAQHGSSGRGPAHQREAELRHGNEGPGNAEDQAEREHSEHAPVPVVVDERPDGDRSGPGDGTVQPETEAQEEGHHGGGEADNSGPPPPPLDAEEESEDNSGNGSGED